MLLPLPTTFIPSAASDGEIFPALASRYPVLLWSGCAILLVHTLIMLLGSLMTTKFSPRHRAPDRTYLRDYQPPAYRIPQVDLQFDLQAEETHVCSRLSIERVTPDRGPLQLDGEALHLTALYVDEAPLADKYIEMHDRDRKSTRLNSSHW